MPNDGKIHRTHSDEPAMKNPETPHTPSSMTYTEMMNEGRQSKEKTVESVGTDLEDRIEELERKVDHLQKVIQRQIRLGKMIE